MSDLTNCNKRARADRRRLSNVGPTALSGQLCPHFGSVLIRVKACREMAKIVWESYDSGNPFGFERSFADLPFVAQDNSESRLRAGIHAHNVRFAIMREERTRAHRKIVSRTVSQCGACPERNGNLDRGGNLRAANQRHQPTSSR